MAKMTKAQARKRISEAGSKLLNTVAQCKDLTPQQRTKLFQTGNMLMGMVDKIK